MRPSRPSVKRRSENGVDRPVGTCPRSRSGIASNPYKGQQRDERLADDPQRTYTKPSGGGAGRSFAGVATQFTATCGAFRVESSSMGADNRSGGASDGAVRGGPPVRPRLYLIGGGVLDAAKAFPNGSPPPTPGSDFEPTLRSKTAVIARRLHDACTTRPSSGRSVRHVAASLPTRRRTSGFLEASAASIVRDDAEFLGVQHHIVRPFHDLEPLRIVLAHDGPEWFLGNQSSGGCDDRGVCRLLKEICETSV